MMTAREAKREACYIAGLLIENYFEVGQPFNECRGGAVPRAKHQRSNDETCRDCDKLRAALTSLRNELERRS